MQHLEVPFFSHFSDHIYLALMAGIDTNLLCVIAFVIVSRNCFAYIFTTPNSYLYFPFIFSLPYSRHLFLLCGRSVVTVIFKEFY